MEIWKDGELRKDGRTEGRLRKTDHGRKEGRNIMKGRKEGLRKDKDGRLRKEG